MRKNRCRRYGLTPGQYQQLKLAHGSYCAICGRKCKLQIDHDHKTGIVRGLVCLHCNRLLGAAFDDVVILRKAIRYLRTVTSRRKRYSCNEAGLSPLFYIRCLLGVSASLSGEPFNGPCFVSCRTGRRDRPLLRGLELGPLLSPPTRAHCMKRWRSEGLAREPAGDAGRDSICYGLSPAARRNPRCLRR